MPHLPNTLVNPNQLRYYGVKVQDNPYDAPMYIQTEDGSFGMELVSQGTTIFTHTFCPSQKELDECPKIMLSSKHPWQPHEVKFPKPKRPF